MSRKVYDIFKCWMNSKCHLPVVGHDTTASAITWLVYSLAKHPEYQDRARAEVDALGGGDITWLV